MASWIDGWPCMNGLVHVLRWQPSFVALTASVFLRDICAHRHIRCQWFRACLCVVTCTTIPYMNITGLLLLLPRLKVFVLAWLGVHRTTCILFFSVASSPERRYVTFPGGLLSTVRLSTSSPHVSLVPHVTYGTVPLPRNVSHVPIRSLRDRVVYLLDQVKLPLSSCSSVCHATCVIVSWVFPQMNKWMFLNHGSSMFCWKYLNERDQKKPCAREKCVQSIITHALCIYSLFPFCVSLFKVILKFWGWFSVRTIETCVVCSLPLWCSFFFCFRRTFEVDSRWLKMCSLRKDDCAQ